MSPENKKKRCDLATYYFAYIYLDPLPAGELNKIIGEHFVTHWPFEYAIEVLVPEILKKSPQEGRFLDYLFSDVIDMILLENITKEAIATWLKEGRLEENWATCRLFPYLCEEDQKRVKHRMKLELWRSVQKTGMENDLKEFYKEFADE